MGLFAVGVFGERVRFGFGVLLGGLVGPVGDGEVDAPEPLDHPSVCSGDQVVEVGEEGDYDFY